MTQPKITGNQIDQSTLSADSILPSQTGNNGKVLGTNGTNVSWVAGGGGSGTVTSVDVSGGTTGLTTSGGPVTTSGTITIAGTLDETAGGTGQTSYATGDILYASASNTLSKLAAGTDGQVLTLASGVPSWAAGGGGGGDSYTLKPVRVATTANITLSNTQTIDGVSVVAGDRVLVKNQSTASQNGVYLCVSGGSWTRATDFDTGAATLTGGVIVPVIAGTINGGSAWQVWVTSAITIGSTSIAFGPVNGVAIRGLVGYGTPPAASGSNSSIAIGGGASASGNSAIAIGPGATAAGTNIAIGNGSIGTGTGSMIIGLNQSTVNASTHNPTRFSWLNVYALGGSPFSGTIHGGVALGAGVTIDFNGALTYANGMFQSSVPGTAQSMQVLLHYQTTDATLTELGITAGTGSTDNDWRSTTPNGTFIVLVNDSSYIFDCDIIARNTGTDTESKAWNLKFAIRRGTSAANTALIGSVTKTVIGEDTGTSGWDVSVTADTTNGRPNISVTGEASKTIRWVANIRMTKVSG